MTRRNMRLVFAGALWASLAVQCHGLAVPVVCLQCGVMHTQLFDLDFKFLEELGRPESMPIALDVLEAILLERKVSVAKS